MLVNGKHYRTVWINSPFDGNVYMIDQTKLPSEFEIMTLTDYKQTAECIRNMNIRGAGAIGGAAGFAMAQALHANAELNEAYDFINKTRPTAANLKHALDRVCAAFKKNNSVDDALKEAQNIADEDAEQCRLIGKYGFELIKKIADEKGKKITMATHCNAGWLAFVDNGSALSPAYEAKRNGYDVTVYVDETGPRNQGTLSAWELSQEGIKVNYVDDNNSQHFKERKVDIVIVGSDRAARNGDIANKIGTYQRALVAKANGIPFYVALPLMTFDLNCPNGDAIPIEERSKEEVKSSSVLPNSVNVKNHAFDVTPAELITGLITPKGVIEPTQENILKLFKD